MTRRLDGESRALWQRCSVVYSHRRVEGVRSVPMAKDGSNSLAIVSIVVLVLAMLIPIYFLMRTQKGEEKKKEAREQAADDRVAAAKAKKQAKLDRGTGKKRKDALGRMKRGGGGGVADSDEDDDVPAPVPVRAAAAAASSDEDDEAGAGPGTRREQRKAEKRTAKAEERAYNEERREAIREKEAAKDAARRTKEEAREEKERARAEAARLQKEAEEKARAEEYDKWKGMFSVEDGGEDGEESAVDDGLLHKFVLYIKEHKVTVLEELAAQFGLRITDVISRVQSLEQMGYISGVVDDRGKFIFISADELGSVAKYIQKKGRVRISALAQESNRLIDLAPRKIESEMAPDEEGEAAAAA